MNLSMRHRSYFLKKMADAVKTNEVNAFRT